jgi:hypothetical protein
VAARAKRAKVGQRVPSGKHPIIPLTETHDGRIRIAWRLGDADRNGPYAWSNMSSDVAAQVLGFLGEKDKLGWGESRAKDIPTTQLCADAQRRLREIEKDDQDRLVEFRLSGIERIWGVRDGHICHVLWWDPDHQVCPSELRHT